VTAPRALIVFDLDGTLIDSSRDLANAVNAALRRADPAAPTLTLEVVRSFIGSGARNLVARSLAHAGVALPPEDALPLFLEEYARRLTEHTRFYPGVEDVLDRVVRLREVEADSREERDVVGDARADHRIGIVHETPAVFDDER